MTSIHWGQTGWPRNGQTTRSDMTRLFNCLGLLVVPALCLRIGGRDDTVLASGKRKRAWWMVGGRTSMGVAVPQTCNQLRPRRQVGYVERACPRTPPDLHLHLSMCLHPCIPCTQSARLLPALWKRNPSLPPSTLPHPPSQAIGPRGAAALDMTSLPSPLSLQYCRRAR
jgi:hypothetical protein